MKKLLDDLVMRTEGARNSADSKQQELSAVRDSILKLKDQASDQLTALSNMKDLQPSEFFDDRNQRQRRGRGRAYLDGDDDGGGRNPRPPSGGRSQRYGGGGSKGSPKRGGDLDGMFDDEGLDQQIREIEDELTIKLPPLG